MRTVYLVDPLRALNSIHRLLQIATLKALFEAPLQVISYCNTLDTFVMSISSSGPALRQPLTLAAVFPVFLGYYAQAVLAILPNTFIFKLLLLPFILWQAWKCAIGLDYAVLTAQFLGRESTDRFRCSNLTLVVRSFSRVVSPWIATETGA